jgi:hypothetical protein
MLSGLRRIVEMVPIEGLQTGHLGGAALDTFANEPPKPDNPRLKIRNVTVKPHISGALRRVATFEAEQIAANPGCFVRGEGFSIHATDLGLCSRIVTNAKNANKGKQMQNGFVTALDAETGGGRAVISTQPEQLSGSAKRNGLIFPNPGSR